MKLFRIKSMHLPVIFVGIWLLIMINLCGAMIIGAQDQQQEQIQSQPQPSDLEIKVQTTSSAINDLEDMLLESILDPMAKKYSQSNIEQLNNILTSNKNNSPLSNESDSSINDWQYIDNLLNYIQLINSKTLRNNLFNPRIIRKSTLKMANRFGKRDKLRMSNRFGRR